MADTGKRIGPTQLSTTPATVYTAPALTTAALHSLFVCNEGGVTASFTISIGTDGAGKRLYYKQSVAAGETFGGTFQETGLIVLSAGEIIQAYANSPNALTLTVSGVESS